MSDPTVTRLKTPEDCEQYAKNVETKHPELAKQARRRAVDLRAHKFGASTEVEREALRCIFAFEEARSQQTGKRARANRTWQSVKRDGILATVDRVVSRRIATDGYAALVEAGLADFTFEAVVLKYPESFSPEAVSRSQARLNEEKA